MRTLKIFLSYVLFRLFVPKIMTKIQNVDERKITQKYRGYARRSDTSNPPFFGTTADFVVAGAEGRGTPLLVNGIAVAIDDNDFDTVTEVGGAVCGLIA